jgi:bifunctional DNase/RNase
MTLEAVETARPLTYQMAPGLLEASGARLAEARITRLTDGVCYAVLVVDGPAGPNEVDARQAWPTRAAELAAETEETLRQARERPC